MNWTRLTLTFYLMYKVFRSKMLDPAGHVVFITSQGVVTITVLRLQCELTIFIQHFRGNLNFESLVSQNSEILFL